MKRLVTLFFLLSRFLSGITPGIETYSDDFLFLPENLRGMTRLPFSWLTTSNQKAFPGTDTTISQAEWRSGDYSLSDVRVYLSPGNTNGKWILAGQWLSYEGYSQYKRNDFLIGYQGNNQTIYISSLSVKPQLFESTFIRHTNWNIRTYNLDWNLVKKYETFDMESSVSGRFSRFYPNRGDSLLFGRNRDVELTGELLLNRKNFSISLEGEWYELWPGKDHIRFSQMNLVPVYTHRFGEMGLTFSSNNESFFGYDGWINLSAYGLMGEIALESYFYPAILQSRYGADTEADFMAFRFSFERIFNEYFTVSVRHGWSKRLDETFSLYYSPDKSRIMEIRENEVMLMKGGGELKFEGKNIGLDLKWNYRDFNGYEFLWYHPGRINIQPGFQAGSVFFENLNLIFRLEGLWQYHDRVETVWFDPALPGFVPVRPSSGLQTGDWTMNGEIKAKVKTLTLIARIENIFKKDIFISTNLMPNSRMFVLDIQWLWYQ